MIVAFVKANLIIGLKVLNSSKMFRKSVGIVVFSVLVAIQCFVYILFNFPHGCYDLLVNQGLVSIDVIPKFTEHQYQTSVPQMKKSTVTFVGVGKSVDADLLASILSQVDTLSHDFLDYRVILAIDGLDPSSRADRILSDWVNLDKPRRSHMTSLAAKSDPIAFRRLPREGRISTVRNEALAAYRRGTPTDYIFMFDMDIVGWDRAGVQDSFKRSDQWDVVCSNGIILHGVYRDIYAFRVDGLNSNHHYSGDDSYLYNITAEQRANYREHYVVKTNLTF